jgi:hypothetical protein
MTRTFEVVMYGPAYQLNVDGWVQTRPAVTRAEYIRKLQVEAEVRNVSVYCHDHGALPGERCTPSMRACYRRKQTARGVE